MKMFIFRLEVELRRWWYKRTLRCEICSNKILGHKISNYHGGIDDDKGVTRFVCMQCYDWFNSGPRKKKIVNDHIYIMGSKSKTKVVK